MSTREDEKKKWELAQCQLVAEEINKADETDYEARPSTTEPADVVLTSVSGKHSPLPVQVVSIPLDFRHRDDKHSVAKVQVTLDRLLSNRGLRHCVVGLILSGEAEMHGIKHSLLEQLAEIVLNEAEKGDRTLRYQDILELSPELAELIHDIIISHHGEIPALEIDIPAGSALPPDGRWIEEGIQKKVEKYGGGKAVQDLVLVIGVAGFVDDDQVAAFQNSHRAEMLPFSEIWIVTPFHGVICLKPNRAGHGRSGRGSGPSKLEMIGIVVLILWLVRDFVTYFPLHGLGGFVGGTIADVRVWLLVVGLLLWHLRSHKTSERERT